MNDPRIPSPPEAVRPGEPGPRDDPDSHPSFPSGRRDVRAPSARRTHAPVVAAVALGGALGASARYAASLLWPAAPGGFPWATFSVNVVGCALIGVFLVLLSEVWVAHRLVRPFVGTGVLGGFTTFSAYAAEIRNLLLAGPAAMGLVYLGLTLVAALAAVWASASLTRLALVGRRP